MYLLVKDGIQSVGLREENAVEYSVPWRRMIDFGYCCRGQSEREEEACSVFRDREGNVIPAALMCFYILCRFMPNFQPCYFFADDGLFDRAGGQYFLGDMIYVEAAVKQYHHVPLRVFVDSCVASVQDSNAGPKYALIDNHG